MTEVPARSRIRPRRPSAAAAVSRKAAAATRSTSPCSALDLRVLRRDRWLSSVRLGKEHAAAPLAGSTGRAPVAELMGRDFVHMSAAEQGAGATRTWASGLPVPPSVARFSALDNGHAGRASGACRWRWRGERAWPHRFERASARRGARSHHPGNCPAASATQVAVAAGVGRRAGPGVVSPTSPLATFDRATVAQGRADVRLARERGTVRRRRTTWCWLRRCTRVLESALRRWRRCPTRVAGSAGASARWRRRDGRNVVLSPSSPASPCSASRSAWRRSWSRCR